MLGAAPQIEPKHPSRRQAWHAIRAKPDALLDRDGVKVSKSPWGPDDEIGRLNWITPEIEPGDPRAARRRGTSST